MVVWMQIVRQWCLYLKSNDISCNQTPYTTLQDPVETQDTNDNILKNLF